MQSVDAFMHVNPGLEPHQAILVAFNPTDEAVEDTVEANVYYAGIEEGEVVMENEEGRRERAEVDRHYDVQVKVGESYKLFRKAILRVKCCRIFCSSD